MHTHNEMTSTCVYDCTQSYRHPVISGVSLHALLSFTALKMDTDTGQLCYHKSSLRVSLVQLAVPLTLQAGVVSRASRRHWHS